MFTMVNNVLIISSKDLVTFQAICLLLYGLKIHYFMEFEEFKDFTMYYIAANIGDEDEEKIKRIIKDDLKARHLIS